MIEINKIEEKHINETFNAQLSEELSEQLLSNINIDRELFKSYISRLKGKGLIVDCYGAWLTHDTPFFLEIVNGKISNLYKMLFKYINC